MSEILSSDYVRVSYPAERVVLIEMNDPPFNPISSEKSLAMEKALAEYDENPNLCCAIVTSVGKKGFCAGANLKKWLTLGDKSLGDENLKSGLLGISRRDGKKPVICAANGLCLGGGFEVVLNCDIVVAADHAKFGFPEAKVGVSVRGGGIARLAATVGIQRASELLFVCEPISAQTAHEWGIVNRVVPYEKLLPTAIEIASKIASNCPESVITNRRALLYALGNMEQPTEQMIRSREQYVLEQSDNHFEGLRAFTEKRKPKWGPSKI